MQDLQADLAARLMHRLGDHAMVIGLFSRGQLCRPAVNAAFFIGSDAAGHHQADAAPGPLGKIHRHAFEAARLFLQTGVHRAHQRAVAQGGKAQIKRGKQVRVRGGGHKNSIKQDHGMRMPWAPVDYSGPVGPFIAPQ